MIRNIMSQMGEIGIYGIISMLIFFAFFVGMLLWVLFMRKTHVRHMAGLPLEPDSTPAPGEHHHD